MSGPHENQRLTTAEAADRLGVKPETLYAYVSRGTIERRRQPGGPSTFAERDIERLARTGRRTRAVPPLVFPSALTLIADGRYSYRGVDAVQMASSRTFEEVAEWLWLGEWPDELAWPFDRQALDEVKAAQAAVRAGALPLDRLRIVAAVAAAADDHRHGTDPTVVVPAARRLVRLLVHGLPRVDGRAARRVEPTRTVAEVLWTRLTAQRRSAEAVNVLDTALVLMADHELASSTVAARSAAMVRADVYGVVGAGLNVASGTRHGGASLRLEALLHEVVRTGNLRPVSAEFDHARSIGGFGHPLYVDGDPRAPALLDRLDELDAPDRRTTLVRDAIDLLAERSGRAPNVDAALAAVAVSADMVPGAAEAVFAVARCAGWIAHAMEQYDSPTFMRTRVDYTGPPPEQPQ